MSAFFMPNTLEKPTLENNSIDGWPSLVDMKVIVPGLVHYEDLRNSAGEMVSGNVLVQKRALDRMAASIEGKPIINWDHRKVAPGEFSKGRFQGIITSPALFNSEDGWYHAKGYVWDESTRKNIENGFAISCAYTVSEWGDGGSHNKVPYEKEVLNGCYTHIAVVPTPRYEGARIELLNSGGKTMNILKLFGKGKEEAGVEVDTEKSVVAIDGKDIPVSELINSYQKQAKTESLALKDDDMIEVGGKKVTVLELKNAHAVVLKNSMETEHKDGNHKDSAKENCGLCNSTEDEKKKKAEEEEQRNSAAAAEAAEVKRKADQELKNAAEKTAKEKALAEAKRLEELRNKGGKVEMPKIKSVYDQMAEGVERYGGKPTGVAK